MGHVIEPGAGGDLPPSSCNGLDAFSESVTSTMFAADPPRPQGGSIANGVYHLTRIEDFVGASGSTNEPRRQKLGRLYISASTDSTADLQLAWLDNFGELPLPIEQNLSLVITGTSYAYTVTCSTARGLEAPGSTSFTASTNELILIFPGPGGVTRVETFARE